MASAKAKETVASNPVVVFQLGASFKAIELDIESDGSEIQSALAEWTGQRDCAKCLYIGGKHIGGCDKTNAAAPGRKACSIAKLKLGALFLKLLRCPN
nr:Glutaredoxin [Ipomoea batatas]